MIPADGTRNAAVPRTPTQPSQAGKAWFRNVSTAGARTAPDRCQHPVSGNRRSSAFASSHTSSCMLDHLATETFPVGPAGSPVRGGTEGAEATPTHETCRNALTPETASDRVKTKGPA